MVVKPPPAFFRAYPGSETKYICNLQWWFLWLVRDFLSCPVRGLNGGLFKQWLGQTTTLGARFPTLWEKCVGCLMSPASQHKGNACKAFSFSSLWRLECLTICGCYSEGSIFSSIILGPWVLIWSGAWTLNLQLFNKSLPSGVKIQVVSNFHFNECFKKIGWGFELDSPRLWYVLLDLWVDVVVLDRGILDM